MVPETAFPRVDSLLNIPSVGSPAAPRRGPALVGHADQRGRGVLPVPLRAGGQADHHRQQPRGRPGPDRPAHQRADRHLPARPRRGPQVRRRDRSPRGRLHGDPARRPGPGPAAGDPEPDRPQWPDHPPAAGPCRRRRTSRSRSRRARCPSRSRSWRSARWAPSLGDDSIRRASSPGIIGHRVRGPDHGALLPDGGRARGRGAGALRPLHPRRALDAGRDAHAAGARRPGALDRHRGGRQRADLRAHPRGAGGTGRPSASRWTRASSTP